MTVQFKTFVNIPPSAPGGVDVFDDYLHKALFTPSELSAKKLPKEVLYITRVYITTSEKKPIKWEPYDLSTNSHNNDNYLSESLKEWVKYCSGLTEYSGYKIVTMAVEHLSGVSQVLPEYCKEHWQVKEKVYINGPKKKPFPTKAAKHY